ncbi:MAG: rhomboid family intramembrane serine protease [Gemmatimonadaceae bacterium]|nr:rhomboid family intramembrane serine protease [Gemmatimonadaceae bacterium]
MFPIADDNPTLRTPVMTIAILVVTWAVWLFVQGAGSPLPLAISVCDLGFVPGEISGRAPVGFGVPLGQVNGRALGCFIDEQPINWLTPIMSMFLHGSWGHIIGNSLYLWVFGNNVEDSMGRGRFLVFYLLTGVAAAFAHLAVDPASPVPTVGASGAISGIMGAYLLLYPRVRVQTYFPPIFVFSLPAWAVLIFWFASQVVAGLPELSPLRREISGGVAVWAHVGGFVAGALLVRLFENVELVKRRRTVSDAKAVWS